jgi:hypothetical protein
MAYVKIRLQLKTLRSVLDTNSTANVHERAFAWIAAVCQVDKDRTARVVIEVQLFLGDHQL